MELIELESKRDFLCEIIEDHFGVGKEQILQKCRDRELVQWRRIICVILKRYTTGSLAAIGQVIGGRDHATVLHAIRKHEDFLERSHKTGKYIYKSYVDKFLTIHLDFLETEQSNDGLSSKRLALIQQRIAINNQLEAIEEKIKMVAENRAVQSENKEHLETEGNIKVVG